MGRGPCENGRPFKRLPAFTEPSDTVLLFDATIKRTWSYCGRNYAAYWGSGSADGLHTLFRQDHASQSVFAFMDLHIDTNTGWDYVNATAFPQN